MAGLLTGGRSWLWLGGALLFLCACGAPDAEQTSPLDTPPAARPTATGAQRPPTGESALPPQAAALVNLARQDLSARTGATLDDIQVLTVEAVEWRDSSLGCPKPGMNYLTVITPGYRIILAAQGREYDYRTSYSRVMLCE